MLRIVVSMLAMWFAGALTAAGTTEHHEKHHSQGSTQRSNAEERSFGRASDPRLAKRTVRIDMSDEMRFSPAEIEVRPYEKIRFVVKNSGKQMHEMVLGTMKGLKQHAELMRKHGDMQHDDAWMVQVEGGKTGELGWQFTRRGTFYYGCLIPGHFEAGMFGKVVVK